MKTTRRMELRKGLRGKLDHILGHVGRLGPLWLRLQLQLRPQQQEGLQQGLRVVKQSGRALRVLPPLRLLGHC